MKALQRRLNTLARAIPATCPQCHKPLTCSTHGPFSSSLSLEELKAQKRELLIKWAESDQGWEFWDIVEELQRRKASMSG